MKHFVYVACLMLIFGTAAAVAQQQYSGDAMSTPRYQVAVGYNYIDTNAPPSSCDCFGMNGGFVSGDYQLKNWLAVEGKFTGGHASHISSLGQDLTLMTYMGGPKVSLPYRRLTPFAEFLVGGAHASDSYFPSGTTGSTTSANSFAFSGGGGVDFNLTHLLAIRLADVEYLHTQFPNGEDDVQNHLEIGAGIVFRFGWAGGNAEQNVAPAPVSQTGEVALTCSVNTSVVTEGELVQAVGQVATLPGNMPVTYYWTTTGGALREAGHIATIDTSGLPEGDYTITGHAAMQSDPDATGECTAMFHVNPRPVASSSTTAPSSSGITEDEFRKHVKDAFFDYDSYQIRPDARQALNQDIAYLAAHPDLQITIGGYADERGSAEFNLALGLNRANAARTALINGGIDPSRIVVISYGKEKQFCMEQTDSCFQLNRRAQIVLRK